MLLVEFNLTLTSGGSNSPNAMSSSLILLSKASTGGRLSGRLKRWLGGGGFDDLLGTGSSRNACVLLHIYKYMIYDIVIEVYKVL